MRKGALTAGWLLNMGVERGVPKTKHLFEMSNGMAVGVVKKTLRLKLKGRVTNSDMVLWFDLIFLFDRTMYESSMRFHGSSHSPRPNTSMTPFHGLRSNIRFRNISIELFRDFEAGKSAYRRGDRDGAAMQGRQPMTSAGRPQGSRGQRS